MLSQRNRKFLAIGSLMLLTMLACNFPKANPTATQDPGLVFTVAALTLEAEMTQFAIVGSPTLPAQTIQVPESTLQQPGEATNTPSPPTNTPVLSTHTLTPSPTTTARPCNEGAFVDDVTIDDGTEISAGEPFKKIWRLKNAGSCTWTSSYDLVFDGGTQMSAPDVQQLTTGTVAPGQNIDITVNLVAPDDPGKYRGNFKLRNPDGFVFGLGEKSNPFWVEIRVPTETGVQLDFFIQAKKAVWGSGTEPVDFAKPGHVKLSYGGPDTDDDGSVMIKDRVKLENGKKSGKILLTYPKRVQDGYIVGKYPAYKIGPGDYIKGHLGFLTLEDGSCGVGEVIFKIYYIIDNDLGTRTRLGQWSAVCDGKLSPIQISLDDLKGESVHFYLVVLADGPPTDDWAIWSSLGVMR